jgi:uncharacterized protein YxeA
MESKEQALKLYDRFFNNAESRNKIGLYDEDLHKYNTKRCALIAVDEIISEYGTYYKVNIDDKYVSYWQEVKQEIEKL